MSNLYKFPLLTPSEIEDSPTRRDGWSASKEESVRKRAARIIYQFSQNFAWKLSAGTAAMAVTFFIRFYSRKSMNTNHPFLVATASLYLAAKANDEPRSVRAFVSEMLKQWYGRDNPDLRALLADETRIIALQDSVAEAEQVLMFTVGFDFNIDLLPVAVLRVVKATPALAPLRDLFKFQQFFMSACNDIMKQDSTLVLQYSTHEIALAICQFYLKVARLEQPQPGPGGEPWYESVGLSAEAWKDINNRLIAKVYSEKGSKTSKPGESGATEATDARAGGMSIAGKASDGGGAASSARIDGVNSTIDVSQSQLQQQQRPPPPSQVVERKATAPSPRQQPHHQQQQQQQHVGVKRSRPPEPALAVPSKTPAWLDPGAGVALAPPIMGAGVGGGSGIPGMAPPPIIPTMSSMPGYKGPPAAASGATRQMCVVAQQRVEEKVVSKVPSPAPAPASDSELEEGELPQ